LSAVSFQNAVADATKIVVPKRSSKTNPTHEQLVQVILRESVDEDAGAEATWVGEIKGLLREYIANQRQIEGIDDPNEIPLGGTFRYDGRVWVSILDLAQRSNSRWGLKTQSTTQMAQRLRSIGVEPKQFMSVDKSHKIMWGITEELISK
jgi:hypothetical protein